MAINRPIPILICYDIANPKRLQRLHRKVSQRAVMVQYSVYYAEENRKGIAQLITMIQQYIDEQEDDVRIYQLPDTLDIQLLGKQASPCLPLLEFRSRVRKLERGAKSEL